MKTSNKKKHATKTTTPKNQEKSIEALYSEIFDAGVLAAKASYTNSHGFNKEMIEAKKNELLKNL